MAEKETPVEHCATAAEVLVSVFIAGIDPRGRILHRGVVVA